MPTIALQGALRTSVRPDPAHETLAGGPAHGVMTTTPGLAPVRPELPATAGLMRTAIHPSIASATQHLTARECGRSEEVGTIDGTWCYDFLPELMIELI